MSTRQKFHAFVVAVAALLFSSFSLCAQETINLTQSEVNSLYKTIGRDWVSVHDPSVVHSTGNTYYIIGSHRGWARSTDNMISWQGLSNSNLFGKLNANGQVVTCGYADAFSTNETRKVRALVGGSVKEVDFGNFDAKAWAHGDQTGWDITGNMWAPDLIYNPTMKKWCLYMSLNGDYWHSVITLSTADKITGPYVYQGPVHYSGFLNASIPEISWKKTDLEIVIGEQSTLPSKYTKPRSGSGNWGEYWTNDIDPCVFFDEDGELWMTYGSWSGGIFILKLDKETGLRDYTYTYPEENDGQGRALSDPYFGKRIAGGYYSSGEGSYIQHIGDYYYLFMSYGGFAPDGGYEMRTFRSATPDGVYLDATNHDACYHDRYWLNFGPNAQTNGGMKLLGAYNNWGFMTVGECAQGHNSVTADAFGRNFVIYHTKFNDGTLGHQVRTHQLFLNQQGWLCAAPFQFDGETENDDSIARRCLFTNDQIAGTYDVLIHKYKMNHEQMEEVTPIHLTLTAAGKVTGGLTGSWSMTAGTGYIKLVAGSTTYNGVVIPQQIDGTSMQAIAFTATANNGVSIWGYKALPQYAIAYTAKQYAMPVRAGQSINGHLPLYGDGAFGATIQWESSVPSVISNTGRFCPADTSTAVTLTCRISAENYQYERNFKVYAQKATEPSGDYRSGIVAYYDFNAKPTSNRYDEEQTAYYYRVGKGTTPTLDEHLARDGKVVRLYQGEQAASSFARFPNPLLGRTSLEGFTVSAWVYRYDEDLWNALWSFTDKTVSQPAQIKQRMYLTGNAFFGYDDGTNTLSVNRPNDAGTNASKYLPVGEWALVTLTVSAADGVTLYVDGTKKAQKSIAKSSAFAFQQLVDFAATAQFLNLGAGSPWGSPDAYVDDLLVYDRALSATDVRALNTMANRVTDFGPQAVATDDWMALVPDEAPVCQLSIPGTHDSGTGHGFDGFFESLGEEYARTQELTISQQWESGIRAFDLRPCVDGSTLRINHGILQTKLTLEDAFTTLCQLLDQHPTEGAIVIIRHETDGDDNSSEWNTLMKALLARDDVKSHAINFTSAMKMSQLRGKLLVLSRDEYATAPTGGFIRNWSHSSAFADQKNSSIVGKGSSARCYVQDFYDISAAGAKDVKRQSILTLLEYTAKQPTTSRLWAINHTSGYSLTTSFFGSTVSTSDGYRDNAAMQNQAVIDFLADHTGPAGIVVMDFGGVDRSGNYDVQGLALTRALIENNLRVFTSVDAPQALRPASSAVYTISGHRTVPTTAGLYILQGRKVLLK